MILYIVTVLTIGFEETAYTVFESYGVVELCIVILSGSSEVNLHLELLFKNESAKSES